MRFVAISFFSGLAALTAPSEGLANTKAPTRAQCDEAYFQIYDEQGSDTLSKEALDWAISYQDRIYRGIPNPCRSLPEGYPKTVSLEASTQALKELVAEAAFKTARAYLREGDRAKATANFKKACDHDHADGCYAYATFIGVQSGNLYTPEAVAATNKACKLGSKEACEAAAKRP